MKWDPLVHQTLACLTKRFGVRSGDTLLAAVSGGADSICLLHLLHTLTPHLNTHLYCVHVHHGIRGEAADLDVAFVRAFCEERNIPFLLKHADAPAYRAAHPHVSLEEAARILRYRAFSEAADELRPQASSDGESTAGSFRRRTFLCTAHHAEDNAETVLLNLFRGGGIRALAGIPDVRGHILRPLLNVSRETIGDYNERHGLPCVTDESNADTAFARNAIRHELLPLASKKVNERAAAHIAENAEELRQLVAWLDAEAREGLIRCSILPGTHHGIPGEHAEHGEPHHAACALSVRALRKEEPFLQGEILRLFLCGTAGGAKEINRRHINDVLTLVHSDNGNARLNLPRGLVVTRTHDALWLSK